MSTSIKHLVWERMLALETNCQLTQKAITAAIDAKTNALLDLNTERLSHQKTQQALLNRERELKSAQEEIARLGNLLPTSQEP